MKKWRKHPKVWKGKDLDLVVFGRDERLEWARKTGMFLARARTALGDRRLHRSAWGGSVIDSVVGAMLTQNVSDVLSSSAIMNLAANFPGKGTTAQWGNAAADDDGAPPLWGNDDDDGDDDGILEAAIWAAAAEVEPPMTPQTLFGGGQPPRNVSVSVSVSVERASCSPDSAAAGAPSTAGGFIFSTKLPPANDDRSPSSPFSSPPSSPSRPPPPQPPAQPLVLLPALPAPFSSSPPVPPAIFIPQGLVSAANGARAYFAAGARLGLGQPFGTTLPALSLRMMCGPMFGPPLPPTPPPLQLPQLRLVLMATVPRLLMLPAPPPREPADAAAVPFGPALPPPMNVNDDDNDDDVPLAHVFGGAVQVESSLPIPLKRLVSNLEPEM